MSKIMKNKIIDDYMNYANAVIKSRALPYAEDNLKPVLRRILFSMGENKLKSDGKTVKSAKVVGEVMGNYHPHGDASIYDAMVRMGQPWKMRYPLVTIQGNAGSLNGDSPAAMRYTEAKLSKAGEFMLKNLDEAVVPFSATYNNDGREPVVLPSIFPNILCNGVDGIAVGMSTNIAPHNIVEVANLLKAYISKPLMTIDEALAIMPGPDFPLGGILIDGYKLKEIYSTGRGTVTLRAKYEIDRKNNIIKFSEFPYLTDVETRIIKSIKELIHDGAEIEDVNNHIGKGDCYINVVLTKKANPDKVVQLLLEKTPLQKTVKINQTFIVDQAVPMSMNLFGLCKSYLKHQHNCIINIALKEIVKLRKTIHITNGLILATRSIDDAIAIIRNSNNADIAKQGLIELLGVDIDQATAILALKLSQLTKLDSNDLVVKLEKAQKELKVQIDISENKTTREKIISENLDEMVKLFGDSRRTTIVTQVEDKKEVISDTVIVYENGSVKELDETTLNNMDGKLGKANISKVISTNKTFRYLNEDGETSENFEGGQSIFEIENKEFVITVSRFGIVKKTSATEYKNYKKLCKVKKDDSILYAFFANSDDRVIVMQEDGKVTSSLVSDIKLSGKLTIGNKFTNVNITHACVGSAGDYFYTFNNIGQLKRSSFSEIGDSTYVLNKDVVEFGKCDVNYFYDGKSLVKINWDDWAPKGRTTVGAKLSTKALVLFGQSKICK